MEKLAIARLFIYARFPVLEKLYWWKWVDSESEVSETVINPATGEAIAEVPLSTIGD